MTDPIDIPAARALCEAASKGPWQKDESDIRDSDFLMVASVHPNANIRTTMATGCAYNRADAAFIAAARALVPRLLDELEAARAEIARLTGEM